MKHTMLLIDVLSNPGITTMEVVKIDELEELEELRAALQCRHLEAHNIRIGSQVVCALCDENGRYADHPIPSVISGSLEIMFVGNVLLTKISPPDDPEDFRSLTDEEIAYIRGVGMNKYTVNDRKVLLAEW